jgi:peroxiredoxin
VLTHDIQPVPATGSLAPDFTLPSTAGAPIALSSYRGKQPVLLAFFPLAFTSTCTAEMCAFTDDYDKFANTGVAILPISVDSTATLREYKQKLGLRVELLSDFRREVSERYGVLNMEKYYSNRAYFLIDRDGVLRWAFVEVKNGERRDNAEILAQLAGLG